MRPIKTLKEYESRYKDYYKKLIVFSKKEVEDFDKFNNSIGEHALLKHRKWVLLGDSYYEIPRPIRWTWFRGLNAGVQLGTCVLLAGAVGGASYGTYYLLNKNKTVEEFDGRVTEEEWENAIDIVYNPGTKRNYKVDFKDAYGYEGTYKVNNSNVSCNVTDDDGENYNEFEKELDDGTIMYVSNSSDLEKYINSYIYEKDDDWTIVKDYLEEIIKLKTNYKYFTYNEDTKTYEAISNKDEKYQIKVKFNSNHLIQECYKYKLDENGTSNSEPYMYAIFSNYNEIKEVEYEKPTNYYTVEYNEIESAFIDNQYDFDDPDFCSYTIDFSEASWTLGTTTKIELAGNDGASHIVNSEAYTNLTIMLNGKNITDEDNLIDGAYVLNNEDSGIEDDSVLTILIAKDSSYTDDVALKVSQVSE